MYIYICVHVWNNYKTIKSGNLLLILSSGHYNDVAPLKSQQCCCLNKTIE